MSLAQRLNELESANENGLLDDDQYRLLRQNLFERYTLPADVQTNIVPATRTSPPPGMSMRSPLLLVSGLVPCIGWLCCSSRVLRTPSHRRRLTPRLIAVGSSSSRWIATWHIS